MPASNAALRDEMLTWLARQFGVAPSALAGAEFTERAGGEIWISSATSAEAGHARRPPGLRAARRTPDGLKPTSAFLTSLDAQITSGRIDVDERTLRQLLLGRRLPTEAADGYVALVHDGLVLGCGGVTDGALRSLLPTGRKSELLGTLDAQPRGESSEM